MGAHGFSTPMMRLSQQPLAALLLVLAASACGACGENAKPFLSMSRENAPTPDLFQPGEYRPARAEVEASGPIAGRIARGTPEFAELVQSEHPFIVFKDEEGTGADRVMTPRLRARLHALAELTRARWPGITLRVTEAWDENGEHSKNSLHYEGRAADLTTSDIDSAKLPRLAALAVEAGFDWVYCEGSTHVHASVRR
jgi:hypothetical protein